MATQNSRPSPAPSCGARTGILLIAHAPLGQAFRAVVAHIVPWAHSAIAVLDVEPDMSRAEAYEAALALIVSQDFAEYLLMTDLPGLTSPGVVAQNLCAFLGARAEWLGAINMPMLLTALEHQHLGAHDAALAAQEAGRVGVLDGLVS
jgi:mannose PTS system EIIA component